MGNGSTTWVGDFDDLKYVVEGKDMTYNGFVTNAEKIAAINVRTGLKYSTPSSAVTNAEDGDTIKFLNDYETKPTILYGRDSLSIKSGKNVTVDLDGHNYTLNKSNSATPGKVNLEIYSNDTTGATALTFKNGTINGSIYLDKNANVVLGEGLTVNAFDDYFAVSGNHNYSAGSSLTVQEGVNLNADNACTIFWPQEGTLTIEGGTISGPTAVYAKTGTVNITGGTFIADGKKQDQYLVANGARATGDAVVLQSFTKSYGHAPNVTITGGTFISENAEPVASYAARENDTAPADFISGGTYSKAVPLELLVDKYANNAVGNMFEVVPFTMTKVDYLAQGCDRDGNFEYYLGSDNNIYKNDAVRIEDAELFDDKNGDGKVTIEDTVIKAAHDYYPPEYEWTTDYSSCTAKAVCRRDSNHVLVETADSVIKTTNPTCVQDGSHAYTAVFTNELFETQSIEISNIPALGHKWVNPTYEWYDDGKNCIAKATCENDPEHILTEVADITSKVKTPATCDANGIMTYTAMFKNPVFTTQTNDVDNIPMHEHEYGIPTYTWANDNSYVVATVKCKNCDDVISETADTASRGTKMATCEQDGETTYTAVFTSDLFTKQTKTVANIPAKGHAWGEPTYEWSKDYSELTATVVCKNDVNHVHTEKVTTTNAVTTEAACETKGVTTYTAEFENNEYGFETQTKEVENIEAIGHDYNEPTYVWSDDNTTVTASAVCKNDDSHVVTETVNVAATVKTPATCEAKGTTTYTAEFENELFAAQTKDIEDIPALNHRYSEPKYEWSADYSTVTATKVCENDEAHNIVVTVNTTSEVTTEAACETKGVTTYTAVFENNENGFTTQTKEVENIEAIGHDYGAPTYVWSDDNTTVTATMVCKNDSEHTITETVNTTSRGTKPATCEEKGTTTYTAIFDNEAFETQVKKVDNIPAKGHAWGEPTYVWSSDYKTVTATVICQNDSTHKQTETVNTTSAVKQAATCDEHGITTYTAVFTNSLFKTQTKDVKDILPTDHSYGNPTYTWSNDGKTCVAKVVCQKDSSHVITERAEISSSVFKAPTCTDKGTTTYTAAFTLAPFTTQTKNVEDIPATGHNYGEPIYTWSANGKTCTATVTCLNDSSHKVTENASVTSAVYKEATCEDKGTTKYTATFTNSLFSTQTKNVEDIPAKDHSYGTPTYTWSSDNKKVTASVICENDAAHTITETVNTTSVVKTPATCEEKGTTTYTAKFENALFTEQTKDVTDISALGHKYGTPTYTWSDDGKTCTAKAVCVNDESHVITEEAVITSEVKTPATADTNGTTTYKAAFSNPQFTEQTKDVMDIPATGDKKETDDPDKKETDDPDKKETDDPKKPEKLGIYGDVNGDGKVTAKDALLLQRYTVNLAALDELAVILADVNRDDKATAADALEILRYTIHAKSKARTGEDYYG